MLFSFFFWNGPLYKHEIHRGCGYTWLCSHVEVTKAISDTILIFFAVFWCCEPTHLFTRVWMPKQNWYTAQLSCGTLVTKMMDRDHPRLVHRPPVPGPGLPLSIADTSKLVPYNCSPLHRKHTGPLTQHSSTRVSRT